MTTNKEKAQKLVSKAEKNLACSSETFLSVCRNPEKVDDSIDCYQKAANLFKLAKQWKRAGNAFYKAASIQLERNWSYEAASNFIDAANCYKRISVDNAIQSFLKAIEVFTNIGRFIMVAKYLQAIAELYEVNETDLKFASNYYEQAADYYKVEDNAAAANRCLLKVAQYSAELKDYEKAAKLYEKLALACLGTSLIKYSAKEYLLRASLCRLCIDLENAQTSLERYREKHPDFSDQREYAFVKVIMQHIQKHNLSGFNKAVRDYDFMPNLDKWYTTMLDRIKPKFKKS